MMQQPEASELRAAERSARPNELGSWTRKLFSFPVMCMFLLTAVILAFCIRNFAEPDIWWHLRDGAQILQQHSLPRSDTYSFGAAGSKWLDPEWLSELIYFASFRLMGMRGVLLVYFSVLVVIYAAVYYRSWRAGADCKDSAIATLVAISLGVVSIGPRTLLFGWLCMIGLLLVLDHFERTGTGLWVLPLLFLVWVNVHPSWIFGLCLLGLTIMSGFCEGTWGAVVATRWSPAEIRALLMSTAACVGALFVNPFGYKLAIYPFDFLLRQQTNMQHIEEWQPVDFSTGSGKLAMFLLFAFLGIACFSRRQWRLNHLLVAGFALWAGLVHTRLLFFIGLVVVPLLAPSLKLFPPYDPELDKPLLNGIVMAAVVCAMVFFFPSPMRLQQKADDAFPHKALDYMKAHDLRGRIFNQYVWGGYMEWTHPDMKPYIDGRADIFVYNGTFDSYFDAVLIKKPFYVLDKYGIEYALLQPSARLAYLLGHSPGWRVIYSDPIAMLFARVPERGFQSSPSSSAAAHISYIPYRQGG